jgi:hypothetical protein
VTEADIWRCLWRYVAAFVAITVLIAGVALLASLALSWP